MTFKVCTTRGDKMIKNTKNVLLGLFLMISFNAYSQSFEEIEQLAKQGDELGQAKLASLYLLGRNGVEKDDKKAAEWMEKAAKQGLLDAQVATAAMYDTGVGVKGNRDTATKWYEKASDKGHGTAMAILGKNPTAKGSVKFSYQGMRLRASKSIPKEYAKRFLMKK